MTKKIIWIVSIENEQVFKKELQKVLKNEWKDGVYELEIWLMLHTNDPNKELEFHLKPLKEDQTNVQKMSIIKQLLDANYINHGYSPIYKTKIEKKEDIHKYIENIYIECASLILEMNETYGQQRDQFIEFKLPCLLKIYSIKKKNDNKNI